MHENIQNNQFMAFAQFDQARRFQVQNNQAKKNK
jgi:hypothetical protein